HAHGLDQVVHRAGRDALDVGLLDHRGQGLLGEPPGLQEPWEVAPLPELGNAQFNSAGPRLPVAVAVAVAMGTPLGALLPIAGTGGRADLHFHQPLGGKADHLAQDIGVGGLLHQRAQVHHVVGHRWSLQVSGWFTQPDPTGNPSMTTQPLTRYGARDGELASGLIITSYTTSWDTTLASAAKKFPELNSRYGDEGKLL